MGIPKRIAGARVCAAVAAAVAATASFAAPAQAGEPTPAWAQRALAIQYDLGSELGMRNAPWVGTHNSYNSIPEMGIALSVLDSNQKITIVDQLKAGVRSIELDLHKFLTPGDGGGFRPVVCHARPAEEGHLGCTIEKPLRDVLPPIAEWLNAHPRQVIQLYLEDHLADEEGYNAGAAVVTEELGDLIYEPKGAGCRELPGGLSRGDVRAAGAQVVIVSDCGTGSAWPAVAHSWERHVETRPFDYEGFPGCGPDYDRETYDTRLVRYFEDSTFLTGTTGEPDDGITPPTATAMARCGVDLIHLDQLTGPDDPRLPALVWSWAPGHPATGAGAHPRCAVQRAGDGLNTPWVDIECGRRARPACRKGERWFVPRHRVAHRRSSAICSARGGSFDAPRTGFEAQRLRIAMSAAGAKRAWLGLRRSSARWHPVTSR